MLRQLEQLYFIIRAAKEQADDEAIYKGTLQLSRMQMRLLRARSSEIVPSEPSPEEGGKLMEGAAAASKAAEDDVAPLAGIKSIDDAYGGSPTGSAGRVEPLLPSMAEGGFGGCDENVSGADREGTASRAAEGADGREDAGEPSAQLVPEAANHVQDIAGAVDEEVGDDRGLALAPAGSM